jgi:hypothetical protein
MVMKGEGQGTLNGAGWAAERPGAITLRGRKKGGEIIGDVGEFFRTIFSIEEGTPDQGAVEEDFSGRNREKVRALTVAATRPHFPQTAMPASE